MFGLVNSNKPRRNAKFQDRDLRSSKTQKIKEARRLHTEEGLGPGSIAVRLGEDWRTVQRWFVDLRLAPDAQDVDDT